MALGFKVGESKVTESILRHISECDLMYREVYGECAPGPECNVCKKLITMGFELNQENLPEVCIVHCERWRLHSQDSAAAH
ncbi:MAG: hypothetical protein V1744_08215 [Candidatus Altiarchaeota archaeon]